MYENLKPKRKIMIGKKDGTVQTFNAEKIAAAVDKSAFRAMVQLTEKDKENICKLVISRIEKETEDVIPVAEIHNYVENALEQISPDTAKSYRDYRNYKQEFVRMLDEVYTKAQSIMYLGDKENANTDSALVATRRSLVFNQLNKQLYQKFFMTTEELQACRDGYIYIHDMSARRDTMNCCLFNIDEVLTGGFEMSNVWYNEPKSLDTAFDVIGDVVLSAASQQYGGFTLPEVDKVLGKYTKKSFDKYEAKYLSLGLDKCKAVTQALLDTEEEIRQGYQGWEYKFNTVGSCRGDYPFITITFGLGTDIFERMISRIILDVHEKGQGKPDKKIPVLFPKLVFLYDEKLHGKEGVNEDIFEAAILCSSKTMYPDYLSLNGDTVQAKMYEKYGKVISPMGCVDSQEIITYKFHDYLYVESFERMWSRISVEYEPCGQRGINDIHKVIDLKNSDVLIYDTLKGFVKVTHLIRNFQDNWCDVNISNGRKLRTTLDHPFETQRGVVQAQFLTSDDIVKINTKQYTENLIDKSVEEAWLYGFLLCDGCYQDYSVVASIAANNEDDIEEYFKKCFNSVFGVTPKTILQNRGEKGFYKDIRVYSSEKYTTKDFCDYFTKLYCGMQKKNRQIPSEVFQYTESGKYAFLAGMIDADGYLNDCLGKKKYVTVQIGSTNKELVLQQMALAQSLGMPAKIYINNYAGADVDKIRYRVEFYPNKKLIDYMVCEKKKSKWIDFENEIEDITDAHIVSVKKLDIKQYSYDVTTESEHFEVSGVYSHNCRAFLSPWYERGGMEPVDDKDEPVFVGRFNIGAVSLHLPMILAKARKENKNFYEVLDYYLELIRKLHIRTYNYLGEMRASTNPLAYCEGGFYGGHLGYHDKIKPLLKSATASFGITALNELQELYNGKSIVEDGAFALEVMQHINDKVNEFKKQDGYLYAIYGTPAENLCFDGETIVQTYGGNKKIKDIVPGDLVYSYNEDLKKVELKPVVQSCLTKRDTKVVKVVCTNGQEIICTPDHPFAVKNFDKIEYVKACNLGSEMKLKSNATADDNKISHIEYLEETMDVYDITVQDNHNFFVGDNDGILVHNCGLQVEQFRKAYGVVEGVSDRPYVSNSFHCHVAEDISPILKQDLEGRFWNLCQGGRIQYVRYKLAYNVDAIRSLVRRAMEKGFYEGVNMALSYCNDCGHQELDMDTCPVCGSSNLTKIDRMNGYLAYSRVKGDTRLNAAKMAEIKERKSM